MRKSAEVVIIVPYSIPHIANAGAAPVAPVPTTYNPSSNPINPYPANSAVLAYTTSYN